MGPLIRVGIPAGLAVLALTLAPAALGVFSSPSTLSGRGGASPAVAVGDNGAGVAVWTRFDGLVSRVQATTMSAGGDFGPVQTLSADGSNAFAPQAAVDADGDAIVVWTRLDGSVIAQARRISAAGALGPVLDLSPAGEDASGAQVAIDSDGDALAVWFRANAGNRRVLGRAIPKTGPLGPLLGFSEPAANASQPRLAVNADGVGYAVWLGSEGSNTRAQGRTVTTTGSRGPINTLSPPGTDSSQARVDVDFLGSAFVLWTRDVGADTRVQGRPVPGSGEPGSVKTLSPAGADSTLPAISIATNAGNGVAVWRRAVGGVGRIQAVELSPTGGTGTPQTVSPPGDATNPGVATDGSANSQLIWQRTEGSAQRVEVRPWTAFSTPKPVQTLSSSGATVPALAMNPSADSALAAWIRPDAAGHDRVRASRGP